MHDLKNDIFATLSMAIYEWPVDSGALEEWVALIFVLYLHAILFPLISKKIRLLKFSRKIMLVCRFWPMAIAIWGSIRMEQ